MFLIPGLFVLIAFILYQRRNQGAFGPVSFIMAVYLGSQAMTLPLHLFFGYDERYEVRLEPMIYLSGCLAISFWALSAFLDSRNRILVIQNARLLRALEVFQIASSCFAIAYFLPLAVDALSGSVADNRLNLEAREQVLGAFGLVNTVASLLANLFVVSILLAFINLASLTQGGNRTRAHVLLGASTVYILYILAYVGRDGFVYWTLTFVFVYLFFKDFIPKQERSRIVKFALALLAPSAVFFILVTVGRFSSEEYSSTFSESHGVLTSLLEYGGAQAFSFSDHYMVDAPLMHGRVNFFQVLDLWAMATGDTPPNVDRLEYFRYYTDFGVAPWVFTTFIGTFLHDFGRVGTVVAVGLLAILVRFSLRAHVRAGSFTFSQLLIFFLLCQVILWGVFYYRQYTALYYQVAMLLLAAAFGFSARTDQVLLVRKSSGLRGKSDGR